MIIKMKAKMTRSGVVIFFMLFFCINVLPQSVLSPNYGIKSPLTAELTRVDFTEKSTVVWLTIMSDIDNAWFCIDRNTFLVKPDGGLVRLTDLKGLPYCPATYRFKRPGEKVAVSLTFPATGMLPWFSIIEECAGSCLSFRGIVTDSELNNRLNEAYDLEGRGQDMAAYRIFEDIINEIDTLNLGIEGSLFTNLIILDRRMGRPESARKWYDRMMTADTPDLGLYLQVLKNQGVDY
jgi:hypothetical protein